MTEPNEPAPPRTIEQHLADLYGWRAAQLAFNVALLKVLPADSLRQFEGALRREAEVGLGHALYRPVSDPVLAEFQEHSQANLQILADLIAQRERT